MPEKSPYSFEDSPYVTAWYAALGKFNVVFELLAHTIKERLLDYGDKRPEVRLLMQDLTVSQTLDALYKIINHRAENGQMGDNEKVLYLLLISDLRAINTVRNNVIHRFWFVETYNPNFLKEGVNQDDEGIDFWDKLEKISVGYKFNNTAQPLIIKQGYLKEQIVQVLTLRGVTNSITDRATSGTLTLDQIWSRNQKGEWIKKESA
ncbi:hypothetical protein [Hymenobacter elongatus]|uniref:Uncharacterized protein n=1 Tax=Hymenobacter elongatus TaxID=877208 RepID=A0A4Z0PPC7_9BACT|nr:hypothetical protein [Hymenobacter elongatus]TGE18996.1 hypothetical protein E5J99_04430 [Hymenobacter elongatus]